MVKLFRVNEEPKTEGIREFKTKDIAQVTKLLQDHLSQFKVHLRFTEEDVKHWLIPRKDVVYSYVVEKDKKITDFISFYCLPSSVLKHPKYKVIRVIIENDFKRITPFHRLLTPTIMLPRLSL